MTEKMIILFIAALLIIPLYGNKAVPPAENPAPTPLPVKTQIHPGLLKLKKAYPGHFRIITDNHIQWNDGTVMYFDYPEPVKKDFKMQKLCPDLADQMSQAYPAGKNYKIKKNHDPGSIRYEPFFKKMYGGTEKEVRAKLAAIYWLPKTRNRRMEITTVNDIHKKLQAVSNELDELPAVLKAPLLYPSGSFLWRKINDSHRISLHSFGIAIDMNARMSQYWKWDYWNLEDDQEYTADIAYRNTMPLEVVEIFEKYGFIWGGKWYHYDTMHFEYRPELLIEFEEDEPFELEERYVLSETKNESSGTYLK